MLGQRQARDGQHETRRQNQTTHNVFHKLITAWVMCKVLGEVGKNGYPEQVQEQFKAPWFKLSVKAAFESSPA